MKIIENLVPISHPMDFSISVTYVSWFTCLVFVYLSGMDLFMCVSVGTQVGTGHTVQGRRAHSGPATKGNQVNLETDKIHIFVNNSCIAIYHSSE